MREFLNWQFLFWMEALSLLKCVQIAAHSAFLIIKWLLYVLFFIFLNIRCDINNEQYRALKNAETFWTLQQIFKGLCTCLEA